MQINYVVGSPTSGKSHFLTNYDKKASDIILKQPVLSASFFGRDVVTSMYDAMSENVKSIAVAGKHSSSGRIFTDMFPMMSDIVGGVYKHQYKFGTIITAVNKHKALKLWADDHGLEINYILIPTPDLEEIKRRMRLRGQKPEHEMAVKYHKVGLWIEEFISRVQ